MGTLFPWQGYCKAKRSRRLGSREEFKRVNRGPGNDMSVEPHGGSFPFRLTVVVDAPSSENRNSRSGIHSVPTDAVAGGFSEMGPGICGVEWPDHYVRRRIGANLMI